ncbi:leucyl/phenylalanyl-tRNA--protein transferase [soil metagenome]
MKDDGSVISPDLLLRAYASGVFPMAESAGAAESFWVDPRRRGVLPLGGFHIARSLRRSFLKGGFAIGIDEDFAGVLAGCAEREETWINDEIGRLSRALNRMGHAHSVEIRVDGQLVGGVYGVALGAAFFGESMFSRARDASKLALVALVARLRAGGFRLFDTQFVTGHLARLGAIEVSRAEYHKELRAALSRPADFFALPRGAPRQRMLQLTSQTS